MPTKKPSRVRELYEYFEHEDIPMLTNYPSDFWEVYRQNHDYFDRLFMKTYREFMAFSNFAETTAENAVDWSFDVYSWLLANDKRYSELWRLQSVSDVDYSILDNYNVRETHSTTTTDSSTDNLGGHTDTKNETLTHGTITNRNNKTMVNGAKSSSESKTLSYDTDIINTDTELDVGDQINTSEYKVSPENVNTYEPKDNRYDVIGTREDNTTVHEVRNAREDTEVTATTNAAHTDQENVTGTVEHGNDSISDTNVYGAKTNTHSGTEAVSKSVSRVGNIGVFSASKLLSEHKELWEAFNFYKMVFDEIANEFLRIVY